MERVWLAIAAAALLVAPAASPCQEASGRLHLPEATASRIELISLVFDPGPAPRILQGELTISGIDPWDVRRTLQAYNLRSELAQITQDSLVLAPYLLQRAFNLRANQFLQLRLKGQSANLVFRLTWQ
jgi:hypothetical protein